MAESPDEELMLAYRGGDARAFETLYARHRTRLFRFVLRSIKLRAVAEELYQEIWMRLIEARASYSPKARFNTWLYTLAHNRLVDHWRKLDQHILAAAHRAAGHSHAPLVTPAGRHRWYFSLAAAAVLVFAVAITLHLERQQPDPEAVSAPPASEAPMRDAANQEAKKPEAPAPKRSPAAKAAPAEAPPPPRFTPEPPPQTSSTADAVGPASAPPASAPASRVEAENTTSRAEAARTQALDHSRE